MADNAASIQVSDADNIRTITLNRPDVLNSFNTDMLAALGKAVRRTQKEKKIRCLVFTGAGRGFCAGQDLAEVEDAYKGDGKLELDTQLRRLYNPIIAALRRIEIPVLASVNGVAAGAGCGLALACDFRVAAASASFIQAFIKVGLIPDCGCTFMLPRIVGLSRAMEIACTGRKVGADEALEIGMVNRVAEPAQLADATLRFATELANVPTRAMGLTKRAMNAAWSADLDAQLDYEAMLQGTASLTNDHREGIMSFLEKRPPKFAGN